MHLILKLVRHPKSFLAMETNADKTAGHMKRPAYGAVDVGAHMRNRLITSLSSKVDSNKDSPSTMFSKTFPTKPKIQKIYFMKRVSS
jgi:hypothetical protein